MTALLSRWLYWLWQVTCWTLGLAGLVLACGLPFWRELMGHCAFDLCFGILVGAGVLVRLAYWRGWLPRKPDGNDPGQIRS